MATDPRLQILAFQDKVALATQTISNVSSSIDALPSVLSTLTIGQKLRDSTDVSTVPTGDFDLSGINDTSPEETSLEAQKQKKLNSLTFPSDLYSGKEMMQIHFDSYANRWGGLNREVVSLATITLPLPANLQEPFSVTYNDVSIGAFLGGSADWLQNKINEETKGQGISALTKEQSYSIAKQYIDEKASPKTLMGRGIFSIIGDTTVGTIASRATGVLPNPYLAQVFQGMGFREFTFNWKFIPINEQETATLKDIFYELKTRMLPGLQEDKYFFEFPNTCNIKFVPRVFDLEQCVLVDLSINHAPSGPAFYRDDNVIEYDVAMRFKEIKLVTRETVKEWKNRTVTTNFFT